MEGERKLEAVSSNPYFEVLAVGKFTPENVLVKQEASPGRPQELIELTDDVWNKRNATRAAKGQKPLEAKPQLTFKSVSVEKGILTMRVSPSNYKDHIAMQEKEARNRFPEFASETIGTNILIRTADEKLMIVQRGLDVATKPGAMSIIGGQPHLDVDLDEHGNWAPFKTAVRELGEEGAIHKGEFGPVVMSGIIYNKAAHNPSVIFYAETALSADEICTRREQTDEEVAARFIPDDKREIEKAILYWASSPSPSGASALALYGKEKFGEEWFDRINGRIKYRDQKFYSKLSPDQLKSIDEKAARRLTQLE